MKVYVSGPMRGHADGNRPRFEAATAYLRRCGHEVASPLEHDQLLGIEPGTELTEAQLKQVMAWDLQQVLSSDLVVFLPGWTLSRGCKAEHLVAWYADKLCYQWVEPHRLIRMLDFDEPSVLLSLREPAPVNGI